MAAASLPLPVLAVAGLIVGPLFLALLAAFLAVWLALTLTCVGPLLQLACGGSDARRIARLLAGAEPTVQKLVVAADGRRLAARWTPCRAGCEALPPVCVVNGLGATLISIGRLHDALAARGFAVLTYDRAGVGMSDALPSGHRHFGAAETVADLRALLKHVALGPAASARWVLIGPSMGSIVAQAYMAEHGADSVAGFLNLDGFPFFFAAKRTRFEWAAAVYRAYASIIWTGALRPFIYVAGAFGAFSLIVSPPTFNLGVVRGQINEANFFGSLGREFGTMMDCADAVCVAWGPAYALQLPAHQEDALALARVRPSAYGDTVVEDVLALNERQAASGKAAAEDTLALRVRPSAPVAEGAGGWSELPRSRWECGEAWATDEETRAVVARMASAQAASNPPSPLPRLWSGLVVRALSARAFDFPGGGDASFYDKEMKSWIAAEHSLHVLLAADGRRVAFPTKNHGTLFFSTIPTAVGLVCEIAAVLAKREGREAVFA